MGAAPVAAPGAAVASTNAVSETIIVINSSCRHACTRQSPQNPHQPKIPKNASANLQGHRQVLAQ
jgi:hypothetical protein